MKTLPIILLWCITISAAAQNFSLRGKVTDAITQTPVTSARVELLQGRDSTVYVRTQTAPNGSFTLTPRRAGDYTLRVASLGYHPQSYKVKLTAQNPVIDTLNISLMTNDVVLGEATVTALARLLTVKQDTMEFHTDALRLPPGSALSATIKLLPGFEMDKDGKITYQGKEVKSVLVGGKEFFGDIQTALANMPADAVETISTYEKTDEDKEFRGKVDDDKAMVIDLKIKKEYLASWNINTDMAYGTEDRYVAKGFASTFTDRRRMAIFGSVNNVSENQQVDENGNWNYYSSANGLYTYRKAGAMFAWDNGKKNKETGHFKANLNANISYNNGLYNQQSNRETFMPDNNSQFSYSRDRRWNRQKNANGNGHMVWNIDTLKRLSLYGNFGLYKSFGKNDLISSTYNSRQETDDPAYELNRPDLPDGLRQQGINSMKSTERSERDYEYYFFFINYQHLFEKDKHGIHLYASTTHEKNRGQTDYLTTYRYFRPDAPRPEYFNRQYDDTPGQNHSYDLSAYYFWNINKHFSLEAGYSFSHEQDQNDRNLYQLDRYEGYNSDNLPIGFRPSTADSLNAVINIENSRWSTTYNNSHGGNLAFEGKFKNIEFNTNITANAYDERLYFLHNGTHYSPSRNYWQLYPNAYFKWNFTKNGNVRLRYYGGPGRPELQELLPITDNSNEMNIIRNNPNLKDTWNNNINLNGQWFNTQRGDNYNIYVNFDQQSNAIVNTITVDPVTGTRYTDKVNVNGHYSIYGRLSTEQPLDTARRWILSTSVSSSANRRRSYIGKELSTNHNYSAIVNPSIRYRRDKWSLRLSASYTGEFSRYDNNTAYNQNGHIFQAQLAPQVELPFGMKISTDLGYYKRTGYSDNQLNHHQWLWNANISQTFLKNKALTVQLQWVDILRQRTSEYNVQTASLRSYTRTDAFLSYALLHVIYNFNLKGKGPK